MEEALIRLDKVDKSFWDTPVLRQVDLAIPRGQITTIIGKSGGGKSVTLKVMIGLLEPDAGEVYYGGVPVSGMTRAERKAFRRRISYLFQNTALFDSLTVLDNVALPLRERRAFPEREIREKVREKMGQLDLKGIDDKYPGELSGGMKKRVAIARSLAMNPDLILYDEPTAELDPISTDDLANTILSLKETTRNTTIIVSHDLNFTLYISDRLAMMHDGRIIEVGTPQQFKASQNPIVKGFIFTTTKGIKGE